jgi:hypothetical protein
VEERWEKIKEKKRKRKNVSLITRVPDVIRKYGLIIKDCC